MIGLTPQSVIGAMTSASYEIYADSIETAGGLSVSGSYSLEGSIGESPAGSSTGGVYEILAGYQFMERGYLSLIISSNAINLGVLSTSFVISDSTVATVGTDSASGYSLSISAVSGSAIASVTDGTVTAGSEEYGISVSGSESQIVGDVAVAPATLVAASTGAISSSVSTIMFKASISDSTVAGNYNQNVTLIASANI